MEIKNYKKTLTMEEFIKEYRNKDFLQACKKCNNYGSVWSCPPLDFNPDEYLAAFNNIDVELIKLEFSPEEIESSRGKDIISYSIKLLRDTRLEYCDLYLEREKGLEGSKALFSGSCIYCEECSRKCSQVCKHPEKMRYSMDSFGFNLGKLTEGLFGLELLWAKDTLPSYYSLIYGLMY